MLASGVYWHVRTHSYAGGICAGAALNGRILMHSQRTGGMEFESWLGWRASKQIRLRASTTPQVGHTSAVDLLEPVDAFNISVP